MPKAAELFALSHRKTLRFALLIYSLLTLLIGVFFVASHFVHYQIDWAKYDAPGKYHQWADQIIKEGTLQIRGNLYALHSPLLISLLILGLLLSLVIFVLAFRTSKRTYMPLIALIGFVVPLLPGFNSNLIGRLIFAFVFILLGAVFTTLSTK